MFRTSTHRRGPGGLTGWRRTAALLLIATFVVIVVLALATSHQ